MNDAPAVFKFDLGFTFNLIEFPGDARHPPSLRLCGANGHRDTHGRTIGTVHPRVIRHGEHQRKLLRFVG